MGSGHEVKQNALMAVFGVSNAWLGNLLLCILRTGRKKYTIIMQIIIKKFRDTESWDELLRGYNGSLFMTKSWLNAVASDSRILVFFSFSKGEEMVGLIGGLEVLSFNNSGKQLFFYSGIASGYNDENVLKSCKKALLDYAIDNGYYRVILKSYDYPGYIPARLNQFKEFKRIEYYIDLKKDTESIVKGFDPDVRRRARKASREGVRFGTTYSTDMLEKLFELLVTTKKIRTSKGYGSYIPLGIPFSDKGVVESLLEQKKARLFYAEHQGEVMGVQLFLDTMGKAYGILMGISKKGYRRSVPSLLIYEGSLALNRDGYDYYNIGAPPVGKGNKGLKKFKDSLGTEIIESSEEATDFLSPSLKYLNPIMKFKRFLLWVRIPWKLKKILLKAADIVIRGRDQY